RLQDMGIRTPHVELAASELKPPPHSDQSRTFLSVPVPAPTLRYADLNAQEVVRDEAQAPTPILLVLWASWCEPCVKELNAIAQRMPDMRAKGVWVLALPVEGITAGGA